MIVVDCSALIDAMTGARGTEDLTALLVTDELHAPTLIDYELTAAINGMVLRSTLSADRANDALTDFDSLAIRRWDSMDAFRRKASGWRDNVGAYDAAYVVLAQMLRCPLVTRDRRLAKAAGRLADVVVL
jgi:predicted nucleic acid-binding protein